MQPQSAVANGLQSSPELKADISPLKVLPIIKRGKDKGNSMAKRPISFEDAKRLYVHRYTMEHKPQWATNETFTIDGETVYYAPQYVSDKEWYDLTVFPGEKELSKNANYCHSENQTWPIGRHCVRPFNPLKR